MNSKKIEIEVPAGKNAEWVNGVLTLVDEKDNRPVIERIKTFEDACKELGNDHQAVIDYYAICDATSTKDIIAYAKLRIIAAALNEGWVPQFTEDEWRYFPWFVLYTQKEIDEMDEEEKSRVVYRSSSYAYAVAYSDSSHPYASVGSRLAFKTRELEEYAGKQFIEIWADYVFKPKEEK